MQHDLHLKYKFTDRGGSGVYEMYHADDRLCLKKPLGEIRIKPDMIIFDEASGIPKEAWDAKEDS